MLRGQMLSWLRGRFFGGDASSPTADAVTAPVERPSWADEVLESMQKQARATAKQSARLEASVADLDARLSELGATTRAREAADFGDLFDALDALDAARALTSEPHLAEGLARVQAKLVGFSVRRGFSRVATRGELPDARLMRVVGTERSVEIAAGLVSTVVRAAIVSGDKVVREGEVLVSEEIG